MASRKAPRIREALAKIALKQVAKGTTPARVLKEFMATKSELVKAEQADLNEIALNRLAGDVTRPRLGTGEDNSIGLFAEMVLPRTINLWVKNADHFVRVVRELRSVSYSELELHEAHERARLSDRPVRDSPIADLLRQMKKQGATADTAVGKFERT